jgi:hypothetical protein
MSKENGGTFVFGGRPVRIALRTMCLAIMLAAALLLPPTGTEQASALGWKSPSGNIICGPLYSKVVCLILKQDFVDAPCDGTYSTSGSVGRTGRARLFTGCFGGAPMNYGPPIRTIPYGSRFKYLGVKCVSKTTGMKCSNRSGHGFKLRRARAVKF